MKNELSLFLLDYQAAIVYAWVMVTVGILGILISPCVYKDKSDKTVVIFISVICIITGVYLLNTL